MRVPIVDMRFGTRGCSSICRPCRTCTVHFKRIKVEKRLVTKTNATEVENSDQERQLQEGMNFYSFNDEQKTVIAQRVEQAAKLLDDMIDEIVCDLSAVHSMSYIYEELPSETEAEIIK